MRRRGGCGSVKQNQFHLNYIVLIILKAELWIVDGFYLNRRIWQLHKRELSRDWEGRVVKNFTSYFLYFESSLNLCVLNVYLRFLYAFIQISPLISALVAVQIPCLSSWRTFSVSVHSTSSKGNLSLLGLFMTCSCLMMASTYFCLYRHSMEIYAYLSLAFFVFMEVCGSSLNAFLGPRLFPLMSFDRGFWHNTKEFFSKSHSELGTEQCSLGKALVI